MALSAYQNGEYFEFGKNIGEALSEVFLKSTSANLEVKSVIKKPSDEKAYGFITGFFSSVEQVSYDSQALYNTIDGKGAMVWGPVKKALETLNETHGELTQRVWMQLHEVQHIFMEGGDYLITSMVITPENLQLVRARFDCIDEINMNSSNETLLKAHIAGLLQYNEDGNQFMVGKYLGYAGLLLCTKSNPTSEIILE